jgi:hypothetical protein
MIEKVQHHGVAAHTFDSPEDYAYWKKHFSQVFIEKKLIMITPIQFNQFKDSKITL